MLKGILFYLGHLLPWVGSIFEKLWQVVMQNPRKSLKIQANLSKTAYDNQRGGGLAKSTKYFECFVRFGRLGPFSDVFERFLMFLNIFGRFRTF